ncbi:MAG: family 10 glycosylhydrolase [Bacteroidota bacterium]
MEEPPRFLPQKYLSRLFILISFFELVLLLSSVSAQIENEAINVSPKREFRAVWLTTVYGADWPDRALSASEQQEQLERIYDTLTALHFNAVVFQVRARGDLMYPSQYEPWAVSLTGFLGKDPGYDPLQFAVDEAHRHGLEFHAWWNVCKVADGKQPPVSTSPPHIIRRHPEWVRLWENRNSAGAVVNPEYWLDMGLPEVRSYLVDVVLEMVRRYDIDAIHFDYLRYPGKEFDDSLTYAIYGRGEPLDQWRRENLTAFVRAVHDSVMRLKPWVKVGAAPIGIYKNLPGASGWQGYVEAFQDARQWLKESGGLDYIIPQIYWTLESNPRFGVLARDWIENSSKRAVYLGVGTYRPQVLKEVGEIIDTSRALGSLGNCFFRYRNIAGDSVVAQRYMLPALVPPMPWKDSVAPQPPMNLVARVENRTHVRLSWQLPNQASDGETASRFVVYRFRGMNQQINDPSNIRWITARVETSFIDDLGKPGALRYTYGVTALDRLANESTLSNTVTIVIPTIVRIASLFQVENNLSKPFWTGASEFFFGYQLDTSAVVRLELRDGQGNIVREILSGYRAEGEHIVRMDVTGLQPGIYTITLMTPNFRRTEGFMIER